MKTFVPLLVGWEPDERNGVVLTIDGEQVMRPVFENLQLEVAIARGYISAPAGDA